MADAVARRRGSLWKSKKRGFTKWVAKGSYNTKKGDRYFKLTDQKTGKTKDYGGPAMAIKVDGWYLFEKAK